ncbi:ComEC/Rec2 family competence protein [Flavobacterium psychrotrophum]|uniref:ComEC/Rec2 family competence protein n=1 Tax=Flavobacterium psychrotrophum TaxID=2294119 RepID=UPI000E321BF7|nr:ComEC/Rec2 family competence protein [Flavobacterium psychrotrophum]
MKVVKYPIIPLTIFMSAGIFTGFHVLWLYGIVPYLLIVCCIFTAITYYFSRRTIIQKPYFAASLALMAFILGLAAQSLYYAPNNPKHYSHFLEDNAAQVLRGVISERLKPNDYSEKYFLDITGIEKQLATGKLLVTVPKDSLNKPLHPGDVIFVTGTLRPITPALNPYQFDYAAYMEKQNIFHQIKLKDNYLASGKDKGFNYHINHLRKTLISSFSIQHFSPATQNLINALLFGQRQDMDTETNTDYTNAGVIHILAISGLHFTLLFAMLNWLLAPLKRLRKSGIVVHFVTILALMWLFAFLTGLSASVVRSVVMFSFLMVGEAMRRRVSIYNSLAVSALVLLLVKPAFLFDAGFQLSYLAVLGIVWLQPIYKKWPRSKYRLIAMTQDLVAVSLAAQLAVLPLSLYYFNQFPLLFLLANIVVIPLSNAVLVLGIITLILNFIFPTLAIWVGKLLEFCIIIMNGFIKWIASFESLVIKNIPFTLLLNLCLYTVIILAVLYIYKQTYRRAAAALVAVLIFQLAYIGTAYTIKNHNELVVFHNYDYTLLAQKHGDSVIIKGNDSLALQNRNILAYAKGNFNPKLNVLPLTNLAWHHNKKILIIDSTGVYDSLSRPDILLLTQSPKINFDRTLHFLHPKTVVADATNYKTYITRWEATCVKQKIPFHATGEKGSYVVE